MSTRPADEPGPDGAPDPGAPDPAAVAWSALVLTGGGSVRMSMRKDVLRVGGLALVDRILRELPACVPVVVVGPEPPSPHRPLRVTVEQPPGGGPVAGIDAGLELVSTGLVAVCAGDMPFAGAFLRDLAHRVAAGNKQGADGAGVDAWVPVDDSGHGQPLCAVYRTEALRRTLAALHPVAGRSMRALTEGLRIERVPAPSQTALVDVDTTADLAAARALAAGRSSDAEIMGASQRQNGGAMQQWIYAVKQELGLDIEVDVAQILDVAKDAAHTVQRPAAPVTAYLLGYAVASGADPGEAAGIIRRLASDWSAPK